MCLIKELLFYQVRYYYSPTLCTNHHKRQQQLQSCRWKSELVLGFSLPHTGPMNMRSSRWGHISLLLPCAKWDTHMFMPGTIAEGCKEKKTAMPCTTQPIKRIQSCLCSLLTLPHVATRTDLWMSLPMALHQPCPVFTAETCPSQHPLDSAGVWAWQCQQPCHGHGTEMCPCSPAPCHESRAGDLPFTCPMPARSV